MTALAYYWNTQIADQLELPLRTDSIRFAVMRRDGLSSNAWRVWAEESGDIYIVCRDHMREIKVSLHRSGKQHIAFTSESGHRMTEDSRFWDQWREPQAFNGSKLSPSFRLLFPSWGLCLTQAMRESNKVWNKNQLFVEAAESPVATMVSFIVTDEDLSIRFSTVGETPSIPLGILPARSGKKLWVVAHYGPEGKMRAMAERSIRRVDLNAVEKLRDFPNGHVLGLCVSGLGTDGGAFLMPFSAEILRNSTGEMLSQ